MISPTTMLLAPLLGALIGLALGMLGGGGSILTVPILVYILGQDAHSAVATSLTIVGVNAILGAWLHRRDGHVKLNQALVFGALGIPAAFAGARLSAFLTGPTLLVLFALLMLLIAFVMLRGGFAVHRASVRSPIWWQMALGGAGVGFLTGFLGVGGGFLIVPALVLLLGMDMADAVGSSLVVIAINSAAGLAGHLSDSALPWSLIAIFVAAGLVGLLGGARLTRRLAPERLRQAFAMFVAVLAVVLLAINGPAMITA